MSCNFVSGVDTLIRELTAALDIDPDRTFVSSIEIHARSDEHVHATVTVDVESGQLSRIIDIFRRCDKQERPVITGPCDVCGRPYDMCRANPVGCIPPHLMANPLWG